MARKGRRKRGGQQKDSLLLYTRHPASALSGNRVTVLQTGVQAVGEMLAAIDDARETVHVDAYTIRDDRVGWSLAEALVRAARRGVEVRLSYDSAGSVGTDISIFDHMERYGVMVREYRPIAPWRPRWSWNNRNHRKMVIVDSQVGFCGGLNWADEYVTGRDGGEPWRDTVARIDGAAVRELQRVFLVDWARQRDRAMDFGRYLEQPKRLGATMVQVLTNHRRRWRGRIRAAYLHAWKRASGTIYIENAYFLPDRGLIRTLGNAARRGVDVRVIVPSRMDVQAVYYASRAVFGALLRRGVRIYEWQGEMLHAKTCVVDAVWATIGSANLDPRSRYHNREANVAVFDHRVGTEMVRAFHEDLQRSREVVPAEWQRRGLWTRVLERLLYYFKYWL